MGKQTKSRVYGSKASKGKNSFKPLDFSNKKDVQCRDCKGYSHIQSECENTRKKKSKAMTSVWSDEDSDGSQEEDDNNVRQIAFIGSLVYNDNLAIRKTTESVVTDFFENSIATDTKYYSVEIDLDSSAEFETDEKARQDTYENMYAQ